MADLSGMHDPTGGARSEGFEALEPGNYTLKMSKSEMKPAKSNPNNGYLACEFEVEDSNRRIWANYNLVNSNDQAQEIAWRDFNALAHACGKLKVSDSSELHGIPFVAVIGYERDKTAPGGVNKERNQIKAYKPLNAAPDTRQSPPPASNNGAAKPWNTNAA